MLMAFCLCFRPIRKYDIRKVPSFYKIQCLKINNRKDTRTTKSTKPTVLERTEQHEIAALQQHEGLALSPSSLLVPIAAAAGHHRCCCCPSLPLPSFLGVGATGVRRKIDPFEGVVISDSVSHGLETRKRIHRSIFVFLRNPTALG